jgi:hypothetical protein
MYISNPHPTLAMPAANGQPRVDWLAWFNEGFVITDGHVLANAANPELIIITLLPEAYTQPLIVPRLQIAHTQASGRGKASNIAAYTHAAKSSVNIEPHVFGPEMVTGQMLQCMPFNRRADTSATANVFRIGGDWTNYGAVSYETQDLGGATINNTPWPERQLMSLVGAMTAVCATYSVWCTPVRPGTEMREEWRGISHHSNVKSWSRGGHSCPGAARIAQMDWVRHHVATRLANIYGAWGVGCPS